LKQSVQVTILGQQYSIRSAKAYDEVQQVATFVDERIKEVLASGATVSSVDAVVLAFLNVAGSYLELQNKVDDSDQMSAELHRLDSKVSAALTT